MRPLNKFLRGESLDSSSVTRKGKSNISACLLISYLVRVPEDEAEVSIGSPFEAKFTLKSLSLTSLA